MDDQAVAIQERIQPFFAGTLGIRVTSATKERVTAELLVRDELCRREPGQRRSRARRTSTALVWPGLR